MIFLNESVNILVQPVKTAELVYILPLTDLSAATNILKKECEGKEERG